MNERIRLLAEQAGDTEVVNTVDYGSGRIDNVLVKVFNKEKFAELIVDECAKDFDKTYMSGGQTMGDYIRQKFGVEE